MTTLGLGALLARLLSVQTVQNVAQRQVQRLRHVPQLLTPGNVQRPWRRMGAGGDVGMLRVHQAQQTPAGRTPGSCLRCGRRVAGFVPPR